MINVLVVFGTRPEAIKMAPVIKELSKYPGKIKCKVCVSAQHREMLDPLLKLFRIKPDYDLNIMQEKQSLEYITSTVLSQLGYIFQKEKFDYVLVQGDTTTSMSAALAAYYNGIKVGHIEAGLRTGNKKQPFPEEINRRIIDEVSDCYFVHTKEAKDNLLREGIDPRVIKLTGNTVIDALLDMAKKEFKIEGTSLADIPFDKKIILVTAHRRENLGKPLKDICAALKTIASRFPRDIHIVYPVHLNPRVQSEVRASLSRIQNVSLIPPLDYPAFVYLMKKSFLILSDSGGIQEEAPSLNIPVLVLRKLTERPEAVKAGANRLVGTNKEKIVKETLKLIQHPKEYQKMAKTRNPYGDGKASERIVKIMMRDDKKHVQR